MNKTKTCNQCQRQMEKYNIFHSINAFYCDNPKCPNFALLQVPIEELKKQYKDMKVTRNKIYEIDEIAKKKKLQALNAVIQVCPKCSKVDTYKGDNHICDIGYREALQEAREHYD